MTTKPTIVIVPGSWQLPVVWDGFSSLLRAAGFPVEHVPLPTIGGTSEPLAGLADDVAAARAVLSRRIQAGQDIVLLCHSSGGLVGSNAVQGLDSASIQTTGKTGGVSLVVFLSAFMVPVAKSLLDMLGGQPLPWMNIQRDRVTSVPEMMPEVAFNDLPRLSRQKWIKQMTHTSAALFAEPTSFEPWSNGIPCAYVFLSDDNAIPLPIQQQMAAQLGPYPNTETIASGHCPQLSVPDQLLVVVKKVIDTQREELGSK